MWLLSRARKNDHTGLIVFVIVSCAWPFFIVFPAFYGWDTAGKIIKRPPRADRPVAPTKWVLVGHSLGSMGVAAVSGVHRGRVMMCVASPQEFIKL